MRAVDKFTLLLRPTATDIYIYGYTRIAFEVVKLLMQTDKMWPIQCDLNEALHWTRYLNKII